MLWITNGRNQINVGVLIVEITELISGAASVAGGGVFGLLGSLGSAWFKGKAVKAEREYSLQVQDKELEAAESGHLQKMQEARQSMSSSGLTASIAADQINNLPGWAAGVKALYRPFLTTALVLICGYIFTLLLGALTGDNVLSEVFPRAEIVAMIRYTVYSLVFSTATAITWWFGDRAVTPPNLK